MYIYIYLYNMYIYTPQQGIQVWPCLETAWMCSPFSPFCQVTALAQCWELRYVNPIPLILNTQETMV